MLLSGNMSDAEPGFSLELSSDLREMRDWVHEFAASVIRPAAADDFRPGRRPHHERPA